MNAITQVVVCAACGGCTASLIMIATSLSRIAIILLAMRTTPLVTHQRPYTDYGV